MSVFVDTSALYAAAHRDDARHDDAARTITGLLATDHLVTHTYVAVETVSLVHARHGREAVARVRPLLDAVDHVVVEEDLHRDALDRLGAGSGPSPSFVDLVSFAVMRRLGLTDVFAFDTDFAAEGFTLVPPPPHMRR